VAIALAWKRITDGLSSRRQRIWDGSQHAINAGGIVRADGLVRRKMGWCAGKRSISSNRLSFPSFKPLIFIKKNFSAEAD
jgi:hypothetical protein